MRFSFLQTLTLILHSPVFAPFFLFSFFLYFFFLSKTPCSSLPAFSGKCTILEFCAAYAVLFFFLLELPEKEAEDSSVQKKQLLLAQSSSIIFRENIRPQQSFPRNLTERIG